MHCAECVVFNKCLTFVLDKFVYWVVCVSRILQVLHKRPTLWGSTKKEDQCGLIAGKTDSRISDKACTARANISNYICIYV